MVVSPAATAEPSARADDTPTASPAAADLVGAVRSLFTCTRKVRGWVSDAGPVTVLAAVDELGESRISSIAAMLHMDISTVSRSLSALCKEGLIEQRPDPSDARSHLVRCTDAGLERLADRRARFAAELDRRLADWPEQDVTALSQLLRRFVGSVLAEPPAADSPSASLSKEIA